MSERVSQQAREAEPFRWCLHCDADCGGMQDGTIPNHAEWCPSVTGVYPVRESWFCGHCRRGYEESRIDPFACCECGAEFARGDHYMFKPLESDVAEVVCIQCAMPAEAR